jgi:shikimate dehydrogenase
VSEGFQNPIDAGTRYCAVFGRPIRHSASPAMQNAGIAVLGLNWRYLACEVAPAQLRAALDGARRMGFIGLNLTVPHKLLALDWVDLLDESARAWGAVNTIRFEAQDAAGDWQPLHRFADDIPEVIRSQGFNTDADALARSLKEDLQLEPAGARVFLLGAGGAGRVAALKLATMGIAEIFLANRTPDKARGVADELQRACPGVQVSTGYPDGPVDVVINATSLGLKASDALPLDLAKFALKDAGAVYDMIYRPATTPLLQAARDAGCRTANGIGMLLHQGARALELWSGQQAPLRVMRQALVNNVYGH